MGIECWRYPSKVLKAGTEWCGEYSAAEVVVDKSPWDKLRKKKSPYADL
jgi:hypothetical protein